MKSIFTILIVCSLTLGLSAQTFNEITDLVKTNCASSYCHGSGVGNLTIAEDISSGDLYDLLLAAPSSNEWAQEKNMPLVDPGNPKNSFLYRKINNDLHEDSTIPTAGGQSMPITGAMESHEIELVRQWILYGAKENGTVVDSDILQEYYSGGGIAPVEKPDAPAPGEGFQLHFGTLFLEPGEEKEWILKEKLDNEALEIHKIDLIMDGDFSHHFLFFQSPDDINQADGVIEVGFNGGSAITSDTKMVGGWAYAAELKLPEGTAYSWEENTTVKYNLHIKNYSNTSVLPCDVYLNVYTQEPGTAIKEMHSDFFINFNFGDYNIPPNEEHTIGLSVPNSGLFGSDNFIAPPSGEPNEVHLWLFGGHTHQWGTDYDAWLKNADGTIGEQIYEGFYNVNYDFNQGFYDFAEPATRIFEPLVSFDRSVGIYTEATYMNQSSTNVQLGLTTEDEMQGFFVQYLVGDISGLPEPVASGE